MDATPPLIVTARLDDESFSFFDDLRRRHFPPKRNFLKAHLTLFHSLAGDEIATISRDLAIIAAASDKIKLAFTQWRSLGGGVAMNVESHALTRVRSEIARLCSGMLTNQDKQPFRAHITIQNKVESATARELLNQQNKAHWPPTGHAIGLDLWNYLSGPWQPVAFYKFKDA